jgi:hypothetical protein
MITENDGEVPASVYKSTIVPLLKWLFINANETNKVAAEISGTTEIRPPLWSSGQSSWLQIQRGPNSIPGATRFSE